MKKISIDNIIKLHDLLIEQTGGSSGLRDLSLLESALNAPFISFDGKYLYPTIESKAARLGYGIIKNHPFVDGNKRIGLLTMIVFLELNGIFLKCHDSQLIELGLGLASGNIQEYQLLDFICSHN